MEVSNRNTVKTFHLLINSELKPDAAPGATHERHLVPPDTRGLHYRFRNRHPSVRARKTNRQNNQLPIDEPGKHKITYLNSAASSPQTSFAVFIGWIGTRTSSPLFSLRTRPSLNGSSTSLMATRFELEIGDQSLNASRTTMSKYLRDLRSFIVGESVLSIKSSSLSFL